MSDKENLDPPQELPNNRKEESPDPKNAKKSPDPLNMGEAHNSNNASNINNINGSNINGSNINTNNSNSNTSNSNSNNRYETHNHYYGFPPPNDIRDKQKMYRPSTSGHTFIPDEKTKEAVKEIPVSTEQLDTWFYPLDDYDQCFVLAMAVFHGGPIDVVASAVDQLYAPLREVEKQRQKKQEQAPPEPVRRTPLTERMKRLHITSNRSSGTEFLYWKDTENNESKFSTRLLLYISREASFNLGAQEGQIFNQQLQKWAESDNSDIAWSAARALGIFWWQNDADKINDTIERWVRSDTKPNINLHIQEQSLIGLESEAESEDEHIKIALVDAMWHNWQRVASCLDGAYKVDKINYGDAADDVRKSPVLKKLRRWVIEARTKQDPDLSNTTRNSLSSAVAITYAVLGISSPQVGMYGLDTLLELPKAEIEEDYEELETVQEVYDAVVFCYLSLALSGRVREVLQHLASRVKNTCYDRVRLHRVGEEERRRQERIREDRIGAAFDILYWVTATSFSNLKDRRSVAYEIKSTLSEKPVFDNKEGRDLLLEGILRLEEKEWRNNISTLLCAALIEKRTKLVFLLLRRWAELVMRDQSTQPDDVRKSYVRFMRDLAIQIDAWCHHLQKLDFQVVPALTIFIRQLEAWKQESRWPQEHGYVPIGLLAQEVLDELPFVSGGLVPSVPNNKVL